MPNFIQSPKVKSQISFINVILQNSKVPVTTIVAYTVLSGIANACLLSVLNSASNSADNGSVNIKYIALFGVALALFYITKRYILRQSVEIVETSIYNIRMRLLEKLRHCELYVMEFIGKGEIFNRISQDANFISQSAAVIVNAAQATVLVFFTLIYIGFLSIKAFLITVTIIYIGTTYYLHRQTLINKELQEAGENETSLYNHIEDLYEGFKEIKINHRKNNDLFKDVKDTATIGRDVKTQTGLRFAVGFMFSEIVFYLLLGCVVFLLPQIETMYTGSLTRLTASILFIIGPLENIVTTIPLFIRANNATKNIQKLEQKIDSAGDQQNKNINSDPFDFKDIKLKDITFDYLDESKESTFSLGPINFTLKKGEIVCILGGNGSGKSTFLKTLSSLYLPTTGIISINGKPLSADNAQRYRSLFSIIFTDFHLFPKIYGVENLSAEKVNNYIELMGLADKTSFDGENFSSLKLSTGQRKRLALICSMLEDKQIMILDEVTADQDQEFKRFFYTSILPDLKKQGKTVLMVSHDDKYFEQFDKVYKMEYGKITTL